MRFISRANYLCERIVQWNACNGLEVGVPGSKMNFALSRFGMDSLLDVATVCRTGRMSRDETTLQSMVFYIRLL